MKNAILIISLGILLNSNVYSQKIKGDFLNVERIIKPKFNQEQSTIDMVMKTTSTDPFFRGDLNHGYDLFSDFYFSNSKFSNNFGTPKYVALIDYKYKEPTINVVKKDNLKFLVSLNSNIYATLYLIDRAKGVFEVEDINLKDINVNYPIDNFKNGFDMSRLSEEKKVKTTMVFDNLSENEANQIKTSSESYFKQLNSQQIGKIPVLASEYIEKKFFSYTKNIGVYFNYVKPSDDFKGEQFNKSFELIQKSLIPVNNDNLFEAISILKSEKDSNVNVEDKKILKYKIAVLENIINCFYAMEKYDDSKVYVDELLLLDSKNDIANSVTKKILNPAKQVSTEFLFNDIPGQFIKTDLKRFLSKNENELNELNKIEGFRNAIYLMLLNNYINCSTEFSKTNNFVKIDNDFIDYFAETIILSKSSLNNLPNKADENLVNFKNLVEKVNDDIKPIEKLKKDFDYFNSANAEYRSEVRKLLFSKYKKTDFIFNEELKASLKKSFETSNEVDKKTISNLHDLYSMIIISHIKKEYGGASNKNELIIKVGALKSFFKNKFKNRLPEEYFELNTILNKINSDKGFSDEEIKKMKGICSNIYNHILL